MYSVIIFWKLWTQTVKHTRNLELWVITNVSVTLIREIAITHKCIPINKYSHVLGFVRNLPFFFRIYHKKNENRSRSEQNENAFLSFLKLGQWNNQQKVDSLQNLHLRIYGSESQGNYAYMCVHGDGSSRRAFLWYTLIIQRESWHPGYFH